MKGKANVRARLQQKLFEQNQQSADGLAALIGKIAKNEEQAEAKAFYNRALAEQQQVIQELIQDLEKFYFVIEQKPKEIIVQGLPPLKNLENKKIYWQARLCDVLADQQCYGDSYQHASAVYQKTQNLYFQCALGRYYLFKKDLQKAETCFKTVIVAFQEPKMRIENYQRGLAHWGLGQIYKGTPAELTEYELALADFTAIQDLRMMGFMCADIGTFYYNGPESTRNHATSIAHFEKAIEYGNSWGYHHKAVTLMQSPQLSKDILGTIEMNFLKAYQGLKTSYIAFQLGSFLDSSGEKQKAVHWYLRAGNHCEALYNLGLSYLYGEGVETNKSEAEILFRRAYEEHQHWKAGIELARILIRHPVRKDKREAQRILRAILSQGKAIAAYEIARLIFKGKWPSEQPQQDALNYYLIAAQEEGLWNAQLNAAILLVLLHRPDEAWQWIEKAAQVANTDNAEGVIASNLCVLYENYSYYPSRQLRRYIELAENALNLFLAKTNRAPLFIDADTQLLENIGYCTIETGPAYSTLLPALTAHRQFFESITHALFKSLTRQVRQTSQDDSLSPFLKLENILENVLELDCDSQNICAALFAISEILEANRFDIGLYQSQFAPVCDLLALIQSRRADFTRNAQAIDLLQSLAKLNLASRVHEQYGYLTWLVPQALAACPADKTFRLLKALTRLSHVPSIRNSQLKDFMQTLTKAHAEFEATQQVYAAHALSQLHNDWQNIPEQTSLLTDCLKNLIRQTLVTLNLATIASGPQHAWYMVMQYARGLKLFPEPVFHHHIEFFRKNKPHLLCTDQLSGSRFQDEVLDNLGGLYPSVKTEEPIQGLYVDAFIPKLNTIIPIDGPGHYLFDGLHFSNQLTVSDRFRDTLLQQAGYRVVHLSYVDWQQCRNNHDHEQLFKRLIEPPEVLAAEKKKAQGYQPVASNGRTK